MCKQLLKVDKHIAVLHNLVPNRTKNKKYMNAENTVSNMLNKENINRDRRLNYIGVCFFVSIPPVFGKHAETEWVGSALCLLPDSNERPAQKAAALVLVQAVS